MGRCGCGEGTCQCSISAAASYLTITGSGSAGDPFVLGIGTVPSVRCAKTGQSIANNVETTLAWDSADDWDTDTMHDPATNNSRITIRTAGKYRIWGAVGYTASISVRSYLLVNKNGIFHQSFEGTPTGTGELGFYVEDSAIVGDFYEVRVYQNSGGSRTTNNERFGATMFSL